MVVPRPRGRTRRCGTGGRQAGRPYHPRASRPPLAGLRRWWWSCCWARGCLSLASAAVRRPLPQLDGEVTLPGLGGRVTVLREAHGVPQVYADQPEDLFEAQGYLAALGPLLRDGRTPARRLRPPGGAVRRLPGPPTPSSARVGFRRTAEAELALQSPSTRRYLDAYASGVNAYLRGRSPGQISLEYSLLDLKGVHAAPEEWTAVDSLAVLKVFGWQLGSNAGRRGRPRADRRRRRPAPCRRPGARLPAGRARPDRRPGHGGRARCSTRLRARARRAAVRPGGAVLPQARRARSTGAGPRQATLTGLFGSGAGLGSNSWVVSGAHTADGLPMLSNDPHLDTAIPSPLAQVGLHCTRSVLGAPSTSPASRSPACPASSSGATPRPPGG